MSKRDEEVNRRFEGIEGQVAKLGEAIESSEARMRRFRAPERPPSRPRELPACLDGLASYDALGRKAPKRIFGTVEVFRALPWLLGHFDKTVPPDYWAHAVYVDGETEVTDTDRVLVRCVCGHDTPEVPINGLTDCQGTDCGRWFTYVGDRVLVARDAPPDQPTV